MPAIAEPEFGVRYSARRNADGKWTIYDVPIMGRVPKGVRGAPEDIGQEWLTEAVAKAQMRERENGYLSPLNLYHPDGETKPTLCGFIRPRRVQLVRYEGTDEPVVYADFVGVPDAHADRISRGEHPYRSPEVNSWGKGEISAVALLDSEVPYFKHSAMVGLKVEDAEPEPFIAFTPDYATAPVPMAAFRATKEGGAPLFRFDRKVGAVFADFPPKAKGEEAAPDAAAPGAAADDGEGGEPGPAGEDENDGDAPTDVAPEDDPAVAAQSQMLAGIMGALTETLGLLNKIAARIVPAEELAPAAKPLRGLEPEDLNDSGKAETPQPKSDEPAKFTAPKEDAVPAPTPAQKPPVPAAPAPADNAQFSELRVELAALKDREKVRDAKEAASKLLTAARAELKGLNIGPEVDAELAFFAERGKDELDRVVATIKRITPRDPPSLAEIENAAPSTSELSGLPEVAKFAEKLPAEKRGAYFAAVREATKTWDEIGPRAQRVMGTKEKFVQSYPAVLESAA